MSLTEIKRFKGAKNKHPTTLCKCDCGRERLVRTSRFKLGQVTMCAALWYEPLWVLGAAFSVFGAWLADRMYEAEEPA